MVLVVAVAEPRAFAELLEALKSSGVRYKTPQTLPYECSQGEVVLCDRPELVAGSCIRVAVRSAKEAKEAVVRAILAEEGKEKFSELVVGIDLGRSLHAVVVLGDGKVLEKRRCSDEELAALLAELKSLPHKELVVKIGSTRSNRERAYEVGLKIAAKCNVPVLVVDESRTTKASLRGGKAEELAEDPDMRAAYNIALRS